MRSNNNNSLTRDEILSRYFPQYRPVAAVSQGLSGGSCIIAHDTHRIVLRRHHDPDAPQAYFLRHYRALSRLPTSWRPYCIICINSRVLAGVSRYRHCWRSTGCVAIRRGVHRFGCGGSNSCKKTVNPARCGLRLCIWMSMATI